MNLPYVLYAALILIALTFLALALNFGSVTIAYSLDLGDILTSVLALSGIFTLFLTLEQIGEASRATRAQFVLELNREFMSNEMRSFYYRLDYEGPDSFKFDPKSFSGSADEHQLDLMLYRFSFVGQLLRDGVLQPKDLIWIRTMAKRSLGHQDVANYLVWLKQQIPDHSGFVNAVLLFKALCGANHEAWPKLSFYLGQSQARD